MRQGSWIQCTHCGKIQFVENLHSIDKLYLTFECSKCGWHKGINCGDKEEDIYLYYDPVMDEKYYNY